LNGSGSPNGWRSLARIVVIAILAAASPAGIAPSAAQPIGSPTGDEFRCDLYFHTYFDRGSSKLTPEARAVTAEVADYAIGVASRRLIVTGYADTSESGEMELSRERANAVADDLAAHRFDRSMIEIRWKGKSNLGVPTPDHTPEPLNRRVQIFIKMPTGNQAGCPEPK
jgi:outer membrane protein OmpA-like peptidoglycan-associated protein